MFKKIEKEGFYYGFPVALATTKNKKNGEDNITPISSTWTLGKNVVLGIGLNSMGCINMEEGSSITLNLPDKQCWKNVENISKTTGNKKMPTYKKEAGYTYCQNKFVLGNFTKLPGESVETVRIKECPIQLETVVTTIIKKKFYAIVECDIRRILVHEKILYDEEHIDVQKWQPLIYRFREYTTIETSLGKNFKFDEFLDSDSDVKHMKSND